MFDYLLSSIHKDVATVRSIIHTNEQLRQIIFSKNFVKIDYEPLILLKEKVPNSIDWRIYDHCSVVMRLYAIYESFVENLITEWINYLPQIFHKYADLPDEIKNNHRIGVSKLLISKSRLDDSNNDLTVEKITKGLYFGVTNNDSYFALIPEAFILHEQNLRQGTLEELFGKAGIKDAWLWIEKHRYIQDFIRTILDQNTAEGILTNLIKYRNDAAHGGVVNTDTILRERSLLDLCEFVEALCKALAELVTYNVIKQQEKIGKIKQIGTIRHWYDEPQTCRVRIKETQLCIGDELILIGENQAYCKSVKIMSMNQSLIKEKTIRCLESINITYEEQLSLKFDSNAKKGLSIYKYC